MSREVCACCWNPIAFCENIDPDDEEASADDSPLDDAEAEVVPPVQDSPKGGIIDVLRSRALLSARVRWLIADELERQRVRVTVLEAENENLRADVAELESDLSVSAKSEKHLADRVKRLEDALQEAIIGSHACCGSLSYEPHDEWCWVPKARAALEGDKP